MMRKIILLIVMFVFALTSCDREESHIVVPEFPAQPHGGVIIQLNTDSVTHAKFEDTHLYGFDVTQKLVLHKYYPTQKELSSDLFTLDSGVYVFVAVLNVGERFAPLAENSDSLPDLQLSQLLDFVKEVENHYPDMLMGMENRIITNNEVARVIIPLADKANGIIPAIVMLNITLPDAEFASYHEQRVKATQPYNLRGVVEFYQEGKTASVYRVAELLAPAATAGHYTLAVEIPQGKFELLVWVDYTENGSPSDLWYDTRSLKATKILSADKVYTACSDIREVFYGTASITVSGVAATVNIAAERPLAKYQLIADDVQRYREMMVANPEKYAPLDELNITIQYESYLPDGFNVQTGKPNSSDMGYRYVNPLPAVGGTDTEVKIASDYVLVNGVESSVTVTVLVKDKEGRTISRVPGVMIAYKRNMLTTLRGDFLTAGVVAPGINIDTDWSGIYEVEF